jgi:hypothetical protein
VTDERKRDPLDDWRALEDMAAEAEMDRILATDRETRREALRKEGVDPDEARRVGDDILAKAKSGRAVVRSISEAGPRRRAPSPATWGILLAAAAALLLVFAWNQRVIVAWFTHDRTPAPSPAPSEERAPAPSMLARAADLRQQAFAACDADRWLDCVERLDEAAKLDPPGDEAPRVLLTRQAVYDRLHRDAESESKPNRRNQ